MPGCTETVKCELVALELNNLSGLDRITLTGYAVFNIYALACRQCIVDGNNVSDKRNLIGDDVVLVILIGIELIALQVEYIVVLLDEQRGTVFIGNVAVLDTVDVVKGNSLFTCNE